MNPAWQEARLGRLWEQGRESIERYDRINKIEPLERAFAELGVRTWFSGLRRSQSDSRARLPVVQARSGRTKVLPIVDWSDYDVYRYLHRHELPYHPLRSQSYVSIGDVHTTRSLAEVRTPEEVRFFGLKRECGIHAEL